MHFILRKKKLIIIKNNNNNNKIKKPAANCFPPVESISLFRCLFFCTQHTHTHITTQQLSKGDIYIYIPVYKEKIEENLMQIYIYLSLSLSPQHSQQAQTICNFCLVILFFFFPTTTFFFFFFNWTSCTM